MLNWFRKKTELAPSLPIPAPRPRSSFFSTDIDIDQLTKEKFEASLNASFERLKKTFKTVDASGKPTSAVVTASAPGIGQFAMDAPSIGNPLSMAPSIENFPGLPLAQTAWYGNQTFIGYQLCGMMAQNWFIDKVCTIPARDAMRHGYEIATDDETDIDPDVLSFIRKRDKHFRIKQNCVELMKFKRVFGIRIAMPVVENSDPNYYIEPFDIRKVKPGSYKGISQIDPYWITPELDFAAAANPASIEFYEPTWWRVNGQRIHRTHLIVVRNSEVVDVLKPTYYYGGIPLPQLLSERVYAAERTANEGPQLALTKRTTWMKVDLTQAVANFSSFLRKMTFFADLRDNYGVKVGGLDDEMEQFDTSLTDFDELTMLQYTIACAISCCPTTKIMGTSPKGGLGAEGEYDQENYYEFLESEQSDVAEPLIERHHQLLMVSEVIPKFGSKIPDDFVPIISWNPVDTPNAKEQAEINEIKARTAVDLASTGAIDGVDERDRLIADKDSGYNGLGNREPEPPENQDDPKIQKTEPNESD